VRIFSHLFLMLWSLSIFAQGPFAPPAGHVNTTAIHKDSSAFVDWAINCVVVRGKKDIAVQGSDTTSVGTAANALGKADGNQVVSLGDGGSATLSFNAAIYNGAGADFAVFENAFNATFLELAFVEVSSDGQHFFRFPSESLSDTTIAVGSFGSIDARNIHNLAGKYQSQYGTPFDLDDLLGTPGLDVNNVTHVRIVDVVGSLDPNYATRDSQGRKINDQYPTAFPSGGFDLDAVGVIHTQAVGLKELAKEKLNLYPNPATNYLKVDREWVGADYELTNLNGQLVRQGQISQQQQLRIENLNPGYYLLKLYEEKRIGTAKILKE
jgi:hypothetical protein